MPTASTIAKILSACALAALVALALVPPSRASRAGVAPAAGSGVVTVKSAYPFDETVARLEADIAAKGITFFMAVDQSRLAAEAGIKLRPSTLLIFGNPGLGSHFITASPLAGLDWPVRLLVSQDAGGQVWTAYTDFDWIARRHGITDRAAQFKMAAGVIASITSSVARR
jgi:uncharacterized protein (DUF302 family)